MINLDFTAVILWRRCCISLLPRQYEKIHDDVNTAGGCLGKAGFVIVHLNTQEATEDAKSLLSVKTEEARLKEFEKEAATTITCACTHLYHQQTLSPLCHRCYLVNRHSTTGGVGAGACSQCGWAL